MYEFKFYNTEKKTYEDSSECCVYADGKVGKWSLGGFSDVLGRDIVPLLKSPFEDSIGRAIYDLDEIAIKDSNGETTFEVVVFDEGVFCLKGSPLHLATVLAVSESVLTGGHKL